MRSKRRKRSRCKNRRRIRQRNGCKIRKIPRDGGERGAKGGRQTGGRKTGIRGGGKGGDVKVYSRRIIQRNTCKTRKIAEEREGEPEAGVNAGKGIRGRSEKNTRRKKCCKSM